MPERIYLAPKPSTWGAMLYSGVKVDGATEYLRADLAQKTVTSEELRMIAHQDINARTIDQCWCTIRNGVIDRLIQSGVVKVKE